MELWASKEQGGKKQSILLVLQERGVYSWFSNAHHWELFSWWLLLLWLSFPQDLIRSWLEEGASGSCSLLFLNKTNHWKSWESKSFWVSALNRNDFGQVERISNWNAFWNKSKCELTLLHAVFRFHCLPQKNAKSWGDWIHSNCDYGWSGAVKATQLVVSLDAPR